MLEATYTYKTLPRQHQIVCYNALHDRNIAAFFLEQGLGKTKTFIDVASNLWLEGKIDAVLLVAPNGVHEQWFTEELPKHSPVPYTPMLWNTSLSKSYKNELEGFIRNKVHALKWFFVNVETFSRDGRLPVFVNYMKANRTYLCIDEATVIKNADAQRTVNLTQGLCELEKRGKTIIRMHPYSKYRAILTGMMVTNSPFNVWSMFEFLEHNYFGMDFMAFRNRYGLEVKERGAKGFYYRRLTASEIKSVRWYKEKGKGVPEIARIMNVSESNVQFIIDNPQVHAPYKHLDELKEFISYVSCVALKKDCLDLPPKTFKTVNVELTGEQRKAYMDMKRDLMAVYEYVYALSAPNKLTLTGRFQQITGGFFPVTKERTLTKEEEVHEVIPFKTNPKYTALLHIVDETAEFPIIVSARFVAEIKMLTEKLGKEYPDKTVSCIYGEVKETERAVIREAFKRGEIDILVVNPTTTSKGFNFQNAHTTIFYSNGPSLEDREQLEDRTHRDGQKADSVTYWDIVAKGTVDESMFKILADKKDLLEYMRDINSLDVFVGGSFGTAKGEPMFDMEREDEDAEF